MRSSGSEPQMEHTETHLRQAKPLGQSPPSSLSTPGGQNNKDHSASARGRDVDRRFCYDSAPLREITKD